MQKQTCPQKSEIVVKYKSNIFFSPVTMENLEADNFNINLLHQKIDGVFPNVFPEQKKNQNHTKYCKCCITETLRFMMVPNYSLVTFFQENERPITDLRQTHEQQPAKHTLTSPAAFHTEVLASYVYHIKLRGLLWFSSRMKYYYIYFYYA